MLVGTVSVEKSELLSRLLNKRGVPTSVNAKHTHARHDRGAGRPARPGPVATNMAGRGVDILLGGTPIASPPGTAAEGIAPELIADELALPGALDQIPRRSARS